MSVQKIIGNWQKGIFKPVYWLEGDEPFFIDQLIQYAEHHILPASEAGFNLSVFYGRDTEWATVVNACRRYPMFADKQVVLLKEAQFMKDIEKLESYIENPLTTTIFIVGYKEKKVDARTKFAKTIKANGELFTTKKIYENELPQFVKEVIANQGLDIQPKALDLLIDHVGNDLSRLHNEIEKLSINLGAKKTITPEAIEAYIGISKEFNVFELQDALCRKNMAKALRIIQYFAANPKAGSIHYILPTLYAHFSKVYSVLMQADLSYNGLKAFFYNRKDTTESALAAIQSFGISGLEKILLLLHAYNLKSIGIDDAGSEDASLMKELVVKIMLL